MANRSSLRLQWFIGQSSLDVSFASLYIVHFQTKFLRRNQIVLQIITLRWPYDRSKDLENLNLNEC